MATLYTYNPAVDDIWIGYDPVTNTGYPTGWNPANPLYPFRSQLQWLRCRTRRYDLQAVGAPSVSVAQKPNYWNSSQPLIHACAPRLFYGACHFWEGGMFDRNRNGALTGIWGAQVLKFMKADGTLVTLTNSDFLTGYTRDSSGVQVMGGDCAAFEYYGNTVIPRAECLPFIKANEIKAGMTGWVIDNQDRATPFTTLGNSEQNGKDCVSYVSVPNIYSQYTYDSGSLWLIDVMGTLHVMGHTSGASAAGSAGLTGSGFRAVTLANKQLPYLPFFQFFGDDYVPTIKTDPVRFGNTDWLKESVMEEMVEAMADAQSQITALLES